jgi:hypothetical protein
MITIQSSGAQRIFDHPVLNQQPLLEILFNNVSHFVKTKTKKDANNQDTVDIKYFALFTFSYTGI